MQRIKSLRNTAILLMILAAALCLAGWQGVYAQQTDGLSQDGQVQTEEGEAVQDGWQEDGTYYKDGAPLKGIHSIDGKLYSFDTITGIRQVNVYGIYNSKLYRFGEDGTGCLYTGTYNKKYYRSGSLFTGTYKGCLYKNGALCTGTYKNKYYKNGKPFTGLHNSKRYSRGKLLTGTYKNRRYSKGKLYSGVYKRYYYKNGVRQTKYRNAVRKMNNGRIYYFQKDRKVYQGTGWKRIDNKRYYFKKGTAVTGWKYVGQYKYYFDKNGKLFQDLIAKFGNQWKKKEIHIKVNRKKNCVTLFAKDGSKGYRIPVKAMACSVGKSATPTVKGTYYLSKDRTYRWAMLGGPTMGGYCYGQYCSRITGGYLFHSVNFRRPNNRTLTASAYNNLGSAASHGCIRLQTANAKIIYDIARNRSTKVTIYDSDSVGPFDKPVVKKISSGQNYDPTDPNIRKK